MSAGKLAGWALEEALTQSLIGEQGRSAAISAGALAAIAKYGVSVPDAAAFAVLRGGVEIAKEGK